MSSLNRATEAESAILNVLWRVGPSTVRQVHEALRARGTGYTTVLKLLQIMLQKQLVARDETARSHVYRAAISRKIVQKSALHELKERVFGGSMSQLVLRALSEQPASEEELAEIQATLKRLQEQRSKGSSEGKL